LTDINIAALDGTTGFCFSGSSVSAAGDFNGDGFDDLIVGSPFADGTGAAYVLFGHAGSFSPNVDVPAVTGANGFKRIQNRFKRGRRRRSQQWRF
jgi:FG-GAP repeat